MTIHRQTTFYRSSIDRRDFKDLIWTKVLLKAFLFWNSKTQFQNYLWTRASKFKVILKSFYWHNFMKKKKLFRPPKNGRTFKDLLSAKGLSKASNRQIYFLLQVFYWQKSPHIYKRAVVDLLRSKVPLKLLLWSKKSFYWIFMLNIVFKISLKICWRIFEDLLNSE